jgi:hypothetical protein
MTDKEWREIVLPHIEILLYSITSLLCEVDDTKFISLSAYCELHRLEINILSVEIREL